jgi:protein-disulfide isomerase
MYPMRTSTRQLRRSLIGLAALWLVWNATGTTAQPAVTPEPMPPAGMGAPGVPRDQEGAALDTYQGTPVGFTADGLPFRGYPKAPLTLVEYSDYLCPFCARHFAQTLPALLERYGRTGQVQFIVHDFPLASLHPTAPKGAAAAGCVAEQGAPRFWPMHDALFQAQPQWNRLPDPTAFLAQLAREVGADMPAYEQCLASGRHDARVQQSVAAGQALGFNGTPSFRFVHHASGKTYTLVGAQPVDVFTRWIDALLAGQEPPQPQEAQQPDKPELPFWATPNGLAPDPKRPGYTVGGDPYKGNPESKLVLVEFGDFQCPACQRHALTTQPVLDRRFVETGGILWVAKHFPLRSHPHAPWPPRRRNVLGSRASSGPCITGYSSGWSSGPAEMTRSRHWDNWRRTSSWIAPGLAPAYRAGRPSSACCATCTTGKR